MAEEKTDTIDNFIDDVRAEINPLIDQITTLSHDDPGEERNAALRAALITAANFDFQPFHNREYDISNNSSQITALHQSCDQALVSGYRTFMETVDDADRQLFLTRGVENVYNLSVFWGVSDMHNVTHIYGEQISQEFDYLEYNYAQTELVTSFVQLDDHHIVIWARVDEYEDIEIMPDGYNSDDANDDDSNDDDTLWFQLVIKTDCPIEGAHWRYTTVGAQHIPLWQS